MEDPIMQARAVQRGVIEDELDHLHKGLDDYDEAQVAQATVHTRQDMVLAVSLLAQLNKRLRGITRIVFLILLVLVIIAVQLYRSA